MNGCINWTVKGSPWEVKDGIRVKTEVTGITILSDTIAQLIAVSLRERKCKRG